MKEKGKEGRQGAHLVKGGREGGREGRHAPGEGR